MKKVLYFYIYRNLLWTVANYRPVAYFLLYERQHRPHKIGNQDYQTKISPLPTWICLSHNILVCYLLHPPYTPILVCPDDGNKPAISSVRCLFETNILGRQVGYCISLQIAICSIKKKNTDYLCLTMYSGDLCLSHMVSQCLWWEAITDLHSYLSTESLNLSRWLISYGHLTKSQSNNQDQQCCFQVHMNSLVAHRLCSVYG